MSKAAMELAREAGDDEWKILVKQVMKHFPDEFERFVELARADAIANEREACAKVCDDIDAEYEGEDVLATWCSRAIRARSNT